MESDEGAAENAAEVTRILNKFLAVMSSERDKSKMNNFLIALATAAAAFIDSSDAVGLPAGSTESVDRVKAAFYRLIDANLKLSRKG